MKFVRPVIQKQTEDLRQEYESFGGSVTELPPTEDVRDLTTVILKATKQVTDLITGAVSTVPDFRLYKMIDGNWVYLNPQIDSGGNPIVPDSPVVVTEEHRGQATYVQPEEPTDQEIGDLWFRY